MTSNTTSKIKLWNKDFFLLWQGQLVSVLGDVIYSMALNFWILEETGSPALMTILTALTMAPRIILGPFAGVFVDRWNRKSIIVICDFIRGIFTIFVGIAGIFGFIEVWMVFIVGILSGICSAFFNPAIASVKPDIVHESQLVKANSATSLASSGMQAVGSAVGGMLYIMIGAPYMFLFNGISFLISAFTELFISIPKIEKSKNQITFVDDFKEGFRFLVRLKVLRNTFLWASLINFFASSAFILMILYFMETPFLGIEKYGFVSAAMSLGSVLASLLLTVITLKKEYKYKFFIVSMLSQSTLLLMSMFTKNYYIMVIILFIAFMANVFLNTIFSSSVMVVIPQHMRGKVNSIISTISMGLVPLGQVLSGILAEFYDVKSVMIGLFVLTLISSIGCSRVKNLNKLIEYDSEVDNLEELNNL